jgi:hypothetical protein
VIRVRLTRAADGTPTRLEVTGHAGRGAYGEDIVCAAVSALIETLTLGLTHVSVQPPRGAVDPGEADIAFLQPMSPETRAIVETMVMGLKDLARSEPDAVRFNTVRSANEKL